MNDIYNTKEFNKMDSQSSTWINRLGLINQKPDIKKILCLKLDHIGDMIVADFSIRLLRKYFPSAHITLICGPWNASLAARLGVANEVIPINMFHSQGSEQHDHKSAQKARQRGLDELKKLDLGLFDLAIDLRVDEDTRDLLKLFDATVYAGIGNLERFQFLDISLPTPHINENIGNSSFRLSSKDFVDGFGFSVGSLGMNFAQSLSPLHLRIKTSGAKSPKECGTSENDDRILGVGIQKIVIYQIKNNEIDFTSPVAHRNYCSGSAHLKDLRSGWYDSEDWGTWSSGDSADLIIPVSANSEFSNDFVAQIQFRAHVNDGNSQIEVTFFTEDELKSLTHRCVHPASEANIDFRFSLQYQIGSAVSRQVSLKSGIYSLEIETYRQNFTENHSLQVSVRGTSPARKIAENSFSYDISDGPRSARLCEVTISDSQESAIIEIRPGSLNVSGSIYVVSVVATPVFLTPAKLPVAHMEKRLAQLVMAVAAELSAEFDSLYADAEVALTTFRGEDKVFENVEEVARFESRAVQLNEVVVGIGIGATKETKRWPFSYMLDFCQKIYDSGNVSIVFFGGKSEIEETEFLISNLDKRNIYNFVGEISLSSLGYYLKKCDIYVGYDTGTTHYAGKVGIPTFGIFAAVHNPREWGPVGRRSHVITKYTSCSPCYLPKLEDCQHGHACMLEITPAACWEEVQASIVQLRHERIIESKALIISGDIPIVSIGNTYVPEDFSIFHMAFVGDWYPAEVNGRWCGTSGGFSVGLLRSPLEKIFLSFKVRVLGASSKKEIRIGIIQNGSVVDEWIFDNDQLNNKNVFLNVENFDKNPIVRCNFVCLEGATPHSIGESEDRRYLGLWVEEFSVSDTSVLLDEPFPQPDPAAEDVSLVIADPELLDEPFPQPDPAAEDVSLVIAESEPAGYPSGYVAIEDKGKVVKVSPANHASRRRKGSRRK